MTPREPSLPLRRLLLRLHASHRRALALRAGLRAAAAGVVIITVAVLLGVPWAGGEAFAWVRAALVVLSVAVALVVAIQWFHARSPRFDALLQALEHRFPDLRSWLRNSLDFERTPPAHGSTELAHAVSVETARRVERLPLATTTPRVEPRRPLLLLAATFGALIVLGLVFPQRTLRSWRTMIDPALAAPPVRLVVEPGSVRVSPGASLAVRARVWGSDRRPDLQRPGEPRVAPSPEGNGPSGERLWRFDLSQLTRDQTYRVRVAQSQSPEYRISLAGDPTAVSFEIEYRAPGYARLPVQRGTATRGDLNALRGTRATIVATFDRDLTSLSAARPGAPEGAAWKSLTPRRWTGDVTITGDGEYELHAVAPSGESRFRYRVSALADAPPLLAVQLPTGDMDLPAGQQIPLEVMGQDDLGLSRLRMEYKKGDAETWNTVPLAAFRGQPREASLRTTWDASALGLLPGQTALLRFELEDNNVLNGPGRALSPTYELRFPGLTELYDQIDKDQGDVRQTLEKAAEQAKDVQKSLDQLARQPRGTTQQGAKAYERSEELKSALERQQQVGQKIDEAVEQLKETLEKASERDAFNEELMRRLHETSELMKQIQSPEFKDALQKMQEAIQRMDQQQLEQNLPDWRQQNKDMLQQLQRTIDMLKRMREEERLDALAKRAQELKDQQDALNHDMADKTNSGQNAEDKAHSLAERQQKAADKTDQLSQETRQLATDMDEQKEQDALQKAAEELEQNASPQQRSAAQSAQKKNSSQSQQSGQKASESLQKASESLSQMAAENQARRRELDLASIRRAAQDLTSLQRESERSLASDEPAHDRADRQTDLSEGVSRVADSLAILAKQQPFISPKLNESLGRAIQSLSESGRQMSTGNPTRGEQAGREGSQALNEAILELRISESECQGGGGKPGNKPSGQTSQAMGQMGQQQSQLNQDTRNLGQRLSQQMRLSAGDQDQVRRLAERQRELRQQLEQIQKDDQTKHELLGRLDAAKRDMEDAEEALREGSVGGDLEQKQERILSRLLDAQRSVNRRDYDPKRESRPGEDIARASAPELPADMLRETDRLRLDMLKAESDRYPAQYRAYIEAYLRSLNQQRAGDRR
jgi:hypothetical protein